MAEPTDVEGSEVRTGKLYGSDDWEVQSVLIPKSVGEGHAREQAVEITLGLRPSLGLRPPAELAAVHLRE
jgi:hypothetical protein